MLETLSESKLRQRAGERGWPVTHKQFSSYREWGLLPEPDNGRWPVAVADLLIRIRELSDSVRSLPRRVIVLRQDYTRFPIPADRLRQAMLDVVPTMTAPLHKMRRTHAACVSWGANTAGIGSDHTALLQVWEPPKPEAWVVTLREADLDLFDMRVRAMYYVTAVLSAHAHGSKHDLADILFEEQIILLTVRDLAWTRYRHDHATALMEHPHAR